MGDFLNQVARLVGEKARLGALLAAEKKRRGVPPDRLVFVGVANATSVRFCAMKAVLKRRANEGMFFASYLHDRLVYAHRLGLVSELPKTDAALLEVGAAITPADVERLFCQQVEEARRAERHKGARSTWFYEERREPGGAVRWVINPDLPPAERATYEAMAKDAGARVSNLNDDPLLRGRVLQASKAEKHATIRWNFPWGPYTLVGVPDGLTDGFVYEFKTTGNRYLGSHLRPSMLAQADLYGVFFGRGTKRVQLYVMDAGVTDTEESPVNPANAEAVLVEFRRVDEGFRPSPPREVWKCRKCKHRGGCPICPL
jgi:hypothetical protein